ncbi:hypothetical protein BGW36DRAFT_424696 [Talaromyces proteolyticus]|uniref:Uncharacterized protein n=1 Tax=Talaromyces proteolyticus TaxID=1131652 RepID=A0AAD4L219_9EURO|nr:uncharacterized protein BGW36DRAFT_424696 [Talaromyces proteolyticus]KAH8702420.1 hypothetical protein BGW36DRAFT_424696 [Talaromyces proteolyticus]
MLGLLKHTIARLDIVAIGPWVRLPSADEESEEEAFLEHKQIHQRAIRDNTIYNWPWILSTVIFASLAAIAFALHLMSTSAPACKPWRRTNLEPARKWIGEHEVRFGGALSYNESGKLVIEPASGGRSGLATRHRRWMRCGIEWKQVEADFMRHSHEQYLLVPRSIVLLEGPEADMVRDKTTLFNGYWVTGVDVVHQIHCLVD